MPVKIANSVMEHYSIACTTQVKSKPYGGSPPEVLAKKRAEAQDASLGSIRCFRKFNELQEDYVKLLKRIHEGSKKEIPPWEMERLITQASEIFQERNAVEAEMHRLSMLSMRILADVRHSEKLGHSWDGTL